MTQSKLTRDTAATCQLMWDRH